MPKPNANESEADFVARCVPVVMGEGKSQDQALGQCYGIYRNSKKVAAIDAALRGINKELARIENDELIEKYRGEIDEVMKAREVGGFESPEPGDIPEAGKQLLATVYARCRRDGSDKEKCAKIAWAAVNRAKLNKSDLAVLKGLQNILNEIKKAADGENTP